MNLHRHLSNWITGICLKEASVAERPVVLPPVRQLGAFPVLNYTSRPALQVSAPVCRACEKRMCLVISRPHPTFVDVNECMFRCDCGEEGTYLFPWKKGPL